MCAMRYMFPLSSMACLFLAEQKDTATPTTCHPTTPSTMPITISIFLPSISSTTSTQPG
jgi:hypothetical protein